MLKRLLLLRHGITDWNVAGKAQGQVDVPLNATGREQARRLGARLRDEGIEALYTSDLKRAADTARIVGEAVGLAPVPHPAWREFNLGRLEGSSAETAPGDFTNLVIRLVEGHTPEGGESYDDVVMRVRAGFEEMQERHAGQTVAVVGHGGVLKTLILHLLDIDRSGFRRFSLDRNTGVSALDFHTGYARLKLLNDASHL